jgi:hypothetical protein
MSVSIGVAVLVMATVVPVSSASASEPSPPDKTALVLGGTTVPTPDQAYLDAVRDHFVTPTQEPGQAVTYVAVTTPEVGGPFTGVYRLLFTAFGPQSVWGLDGPGWPDEPLWKLSGLFDVTFDQSVLGGVDDLDDEVIANGSDHLVIFGYSQGAIVANREKRRLAERYEGTDAPDIEFVLIGDPNVPNGGLAARFPGVYIPLLDVSLNGPALTDTPFHTVEDISQYDGASDFPLYPLNLFSTANAVLGGLYVHPYDLEPSVDDPGTIHTVTGDTDYYFHPTDDLPLFGPLRMIGVPEPLIDVVEPFFRVLVELGYDRSILPGEPTPARLIPPINPVKVAADLVDAVGEGVNNALALTGSPPLPRIPTPGSSADTNEGSVVGSPDKSVDLNAVGDGIAHSLSALNPVSTDQGNEHAGTDGENSEPPTPLGRWTKRAPQSLTDGVKFTPRKPRSSRASAASIDALSSAKADDIRSRGRQPRRSDPSETG